MLRRLYTINFIDAFISGMISVLLPLLMLSRGIDLAMIGLVFSIGPIVHVAVRFAGAALADSAGDRKIYVLSSALNFVKSAAYLVSSNAAGFAAGKLSDGSREALLWSVNRPSLLAVAPGRKHFVLSNMISGRLLYNALGSLAIGFLFIYGGYDLPLAVAMALSLVLVFLSLRLKDMHRAEGRFSLSDFSPFGRSRRFYEIAGAFVAGNAVYSAVMYLLLPVYFAANGFSVSEIGLFYAGYLLIEGAVLNFISHRQVETKRAALAGAAIFCVGLAGLAFAPRDAIPFFFLFMAFGDACGSMLWEELNYFASKGSRRKATDLAVVVAPALLSAGAASAAAGFAASAFGFAAIFAVFALSMALFAAWCTRIAGMKG